MAIWTLLLLKRSSVQIKGDGITLPVEKAVRLECFIYFSRGTLYGSGPTNFGEGSFD